MIGYYEIKTIVWICIIVFLVTAVLALLALVGAIKFPNDHQKYTRSLFRVIVFEIALITVGLYAALLSSPSNYAPKELGDLEKRIADVEKKGDAAPKKWQFVRVSDCRGMDAHDKPATGGSEPDPARCNRANLTAVCWDGKLYQNGGDAWCTYKDVAPSACDGGGRQGRIYSCTP